MAFCSCSRGVALLRDLRKCGVWQGNEKTVVWGL